MEKLGDLLKKYFSPLNLEERIKEQEVEKISKDVIQSLFDVTLESIEYESGILKIKIPDSTLKYEILLKSEEIINLINKKINKKEVEKIIVKV